MLDWIKANKKLALAGVVIVAAGIALATGAITIEDFKTIVGWAEESVPTDSLGIDSLSLDSLGG